MTEAYPLLWPPHVPRTPTHYRTWGNFHVTPDRAQTELRDEVARSGGTGLVISTNRPVRKDGGLRLGSGEPTDPGVAVYFTRKGEVVCIPCDSYDKVWKNIRAIGLSIKDMRGPEGRGCAILTDVMFRGFAALPPPSAGTISMGRPWWDVLEVPRDATVAEATAAYRDIVRAAGAASTELNAAHEAAKAGARP